MTQSITDTSNSIYTMIQQSENADTTCVNNDENFQAVIKESNDKISQTLGDFKNAKTSYMDSRTNFKSFLKQEIKQANDESSLNLTLADDIKNFIAQFQNIDSEKTCQTDEITKVDDTNLTDILTNVQEVASILTENLPNSDIIKEYTETNIVGQEQVVEDTELQDLTATPLENDTEVINSLVNKLADSTKTITNNKTTSVQDPTIDEPEISDEMLKELNVESVDAETSSDFQQNFDMQQQTPEENVIKALISSDNNNFDNKVTELEKTIDTDNISSKENQTEKVIEQISKQLNGIKANSKVNIVLNPEKLGKVSIQVAKSAEGMSAQFTVSTNEAKEILLKNLDGLKETLLSHGINSDNVSIKMNESQKSEYKQDWTEQENSGNKNKEQHHQQKQEKENEKNVFERMMAYINTDEMESI